MGTNGKDHLLLTGISHQTAPIEIRETFSFDKSKRNNILDRLMGIPGITEAAILSTCNRTEFYTVSSTANGEFIPLISDFIISLGGNPEAAEYFSFKENLEAVEHLFRVASGLDSMILGEPQIFGQVKEAYSEAFEKGTTGSVLNMLFHNSFRMGKYVRSLTGIGEGNVSVGLAAVELARSVLGDFHGRPVLLVGTGKIGELCASRLVESGVDSLYISNRTHEKALELASRLSGEAIHFDKLHDMFEKADVVISSVYSEKPVFLKEDIKKNISGRKNRPIVFIDLGVPRSIEKETGEIPGVYLYNIDDLESVSMGNVQKRKQEAEKAELLIKAGVEEFRARLNEREIVPVIRDLRIKCENIRTGELEKIRNKVPADTFTILDMVTRRIVRKILHNPTIAMRVTEEERRVELMRTVQELFCERE